MSDGFDDINFGEFPIVKTTEWVLNRTRDAVEHGLFVEILVWALEEMKADPEIDIETAVERACWEWDC